MTEKLTVRVQLLLSETEIAEVDEWRSAQRPIPSRNATIRMLMEKGLDAIRQESAAKKPKT